VLGRAVVRDLAGPEDATRRLALLNVAMMVGPGLGPAAGGLIAVHFGWRAIFALLAVLGAVIMVMTWRRLPETGPRDGTPDITALARNYRELLTSRRFLGFSIGGGCSTTSIYAFLASAPFFFVQELGRPVDEVGFYVASLIVGVSLGSALTSRIIQTVPLGALLIGFNLLSLVAGCVFLGMALTGTLTTTRLLVTMFFYALGAGVTSPAALAHAVSVNPRVIGSASGLYGFTQMTIGAICTTAAGLGHSTALATAIVLLVACAMGQASFWIAVRA
jgi:DHA1 family bicyclomycin/chloramphenicol resistance-like MFS transporter